MLLMRMLIIFINVHANKKWWKITLFH
jgi:hypothetical protein